MSNQFTSCKDCTFQNTSHCLYCIHNTRHVDNFQQEMPKIKLTGGQFIFSSRGDNMYIDGKSDMEYNRAGAARAVQQQAQQACENSIIRNQLSALAEQLGHGESKWSSDEYLYTVVQQYADAQWIRYKTSAYYMPGTVYMNSETADKIAHALNNQQFRFGKFNETDL